MATAKCDISFKVDYTSSLPAKATVYYRIKDSGGLYAEYNIDPAPPSGTWVDINDIQTPGEYELRVELSAGGVVVKETGFFTTKNCNSSSCEIPEIKSIDVKSNGQIVMDYFVETANLATPEYQIATDQGFTDIVHLKVGFDYTQLENIFMNNGNIPDNSVLYVRARKHCLLPAGVSDWSKVFQFTSKKWIVQKAPYTFDAYCVSAKFEDPITTEAKICLAGNTLLKTINLNTVTPQVGSFIYLIDGNTPALPPSLSSFDTGGASTGFNQSGIRWVRFANDNGYKIYDVEKTGQIIGISSSYNCNT